MSSPQAERADSFPGHRRSALSKASRTGRCRAARFRERKPTMTENEDRQVREVLKEVYAAGEGNDADAFAEPDTESRALQTWVLSRQDGAWRVQALHNCPEQV